jgi:cell division protease FtsH
VAFEIDTEVRRLIDEAHDEALEILQTERGKLDQIASALIERETIEKDDLVRLLERIEKRAPKEGSRQGAGVAVFRRSVRGPKDSGESLR